MDLKDMLGSAVKEAQKHPELLSSVAGFAKGKMSGGKEPASAGTTTKQRSSGKRAAAR